MADNPRIEELRRRVQADPASIAFAALAEEYRRAGRFEDAIEACRTGLQRHPSYLSARVTLGRSLVELQRYDDARQELELVLRAAPENLAAIRALAEIHERRGESPEALEQYRVAISVARQEAAASGPAAPPHAAPPAAPAAAVAFAPPPVPAPVAFAPPAPAPAPAPAPVAIAPPPAPAPVAIAPPAPAPAPAAPSIVVTLPVPSPTPAEWELPGPAIPPPGTARISTALARVQAAAARDDRRDVLDRLERFLASIQTARGAALPAQTRVAAR